MCSHMTKREVKICRISNLAELRQTNCANLEQSVSVVHPKVNQINARQDPGNQKVERLPYDVLVYNLSYFTVASISAYFQIHMENYIESFSWLFII